MSVSKEMKYIIIESSLCDYPVLFSLGHPHQDFSHMKPSSAGFCRIDYDGKEFKVSCYGESTGLKLKSNPKRDEALISIMLNDRW